MGAWLTHAPRAVHGEDQGAARYGDANATGLQLAQVTRATVAAVIVAAAGIIEKTVENRPVAVNYCYTDSSSVCVYRCTWILDSSSRGQSVQHTAHAACSTLRTTQLRHAANCKLQMLPSGGIIYNHGY